MKTEEIVSSSLRRTLAPTSQVTYSTSELVSMANEELLISLVGDILSVREDFFLRLKQVPIVAKVPYYPVPSRAIGNSLKKVFYVDTGGQRVPLRRATIEDESLLSGVTGSPERFLVVGDELRLLPTPAASDGYLEQWYFSRPSTLVETTSVGRIESLLTVGSTVVITVGADLTSLIVPGGKADLLSVASPFLLWSEDVVVSAITATTVTVALSAITDEAGTIQPQVGDYLCPAGTAHIPMVPLEYHPILSQMLACRILEGLADLQKLQAAAAKLGEMRKQSFSLVSNRIESESEPIVNRQGLLEAATGFSGSFT